MLSIRFYGALGLLAAAASHAPLSAETLPIEGVYAARSDAALTTKTIAVDAFTGDEGPALEFAIKDALQAIEFERSGPWFEIVPTDGDDVQAVLRGSASYELFEERLESKRETKCLKKNEDKECIKERVSYIPCYRLSLRYFPEVRLMAVDGRDLYAHSTSQEASRSYCEDDTNVPSANSLLKRMHERVARGMRLTLAPVRRYENVRVLESRKSLNREDRKPFKQAVKMTKHDVLGACLAFRELEDRNPQHVSVLFNVGLCHENEGDLLTARGYYERALQVEPGKSYPQVGLSRISDRMLATEQFAMREEAETEWLASADAPRQAAVSSEKQGK